MPENDETSRLRARALRLLARREHSRHELKLKLQRSCSQPLLDALLTELAQNNLQSDQRFVEAYIHTRMQAGYGPQRISNDLRAKGIDESLIDQYLSHDEQKWRQIMIATWNKKFARNANSEKSPLRRQFAFLLQRGFEPNQIKKFLMQDCFYEVDE